MKLEICDKCGGIMGLPHRVIFKEPINGHTTEICLCINCFKEILNPLKDQQNLIHTKHINFINDTNEGKVRMVQ